MNNDLYFKKEVLLEALRNILANISIDINEGCNDCEKLKAHSQYYSCICLKTFYKFNMLNKTYTRKDMAIKKFNILYAETYNEALNNPNDLIEYYDTQKYTNCTEDEQFILLAIFNLKTFIKGNNINMIKHTINTYIPKLKKTLKNGDKYINYLNLDTNNTLKIKTILFKFLVENG